uniref:Uncharacterized protein n=1 Tax=Solanum lycopersicum TaxID=4081 RepID=A0A3Q7ETM9_SOLLC
MYSLILRFYNVSSLAKNVRLIITVCCIRLKYGVLEGLCSFEEACSNITVVFEGFRNEYFTSSIFRKIDYGWLRLCLRIGNTFEFTIFITLRNQDNVYFLLFLITSLHCVGKSMSCNGVMEDEEI